MSGGGLNYEEGPVVSDHRAADHLHGLLPELNGVELAMSLSPKQQQQQQLSASSAGAGGGGAAGNTTTSHHQTTNNNNNNLSHHNHLHGHHPHHIHHHHLHHLQSGGPPQVLSHLQSLHHSTPFSVTDILSPIEESYRKLELATNPPSPYR